MSWLGLGEVSDDMRGCVGGLSAGVLEGYPRVC